MRRGSLTVLVNFGDREQVVTVGDVAVLFETGPGVVAADGALTLPPHAGALVRAAQ